MSRHTVLGLPAVEAVGRAPGHHLGQLLAGLRVVLHLIEQDGEVVGLAQGVGHEGGALCEQGLQLLGTAKIRSKLVFVKEARELGHFRPFSQR